MDETPPDKRPVMYPVHSLFQRSPAQQPKKLLERPGFYSALLKRVPGFPLPFPEAKTLQQPEAEKWCSRQLTVPACGLHADPAVFFLCCGGLVQDCSSVGSVRRSVVQLFLMSSNPPPLQHLLDSMQQELEI
ncbi:MAG: hypothetical protein LKJ86_07735 [Oscillibacter sp.]|nr:hypothetical protein [Oscillibacter sp.]